MNWEESKGMPTMGRKDPCQERHGFSRILYKACKLRPDHHIASYSQMRRRWNQFCLRSVCLNWFTAGQLPYLKVWMVWLTLPSIHGPASFSNTIGYLFDRSEGLSKFRVREGWEGERGWESIRTPIKTHTHCGLYWHRNGLRDLFALIRTIGSRKSRSTPLESPQRNEA